MSCVERGERPFAPQAPAVLRKQRVVALHADAAAVVDRFGQRVRAGKAQALAEAPCDLHAAGVVSGVKTVVDRLDHAEVRKWQTRADTARGAGDSLVSVLKTVEVMALRPEVADFKRPVRSELPLNIQDVLHRVGSGVIVSVRVGVWRRNIISADRIAPK